MIHVLEKGEKADPLWGMDTEIITDEMIEALQQGKRLYLSVNNEYAVVIKKDGKRKTDKPEASDTDTISRPKGQWIKEKMWSEGIGMGESYGFYYSCSECKEVVKGSYNNCGKNFCPNCGADMRP